MHVIGSLSAGGAERFVVDLVCALKRNGLAVGVAALSSGGDAAGAQLRARLDNAQVPLQTGPTVRVGGRSLLWYRRMLARWQPKLAHLHTENTELAHYLAKSFVPRRPQIVRTLHTTKPSIQFLHQRARRGNRAVLSIACGPAVLERFATEVRGRLIAIPNGIDFHWPAQTESLKAKQQRELGWDPAECHFIHVGGMRGASIESAAKAHDVLLKAWSEGRMGERAARLHLVGDGNLRRDLERLAGHDSSVVFHGIQANVWQWLVAADIFVMPSRFEGLPIAGIEALGSGLPCIFSDIAPLRRLAGTSVTYTRTDDHHELAAHMIGVIKFDRRPTPDDVASVRRQFAVDSTAARYMDAYADLTVALFRDERRAAASA